MIRTHIIIGSAEKISQHISQHKYKSGYELDRFSASLRKQVGR